MFFFKLQSYKMVSNEIKNNLIDFLKKTNLKDLTAVTVVCDLLCRFNNLNKEIVRNLVELILPFIHNKGMKMRAVAWFDFNSHNIKG